MFGFGKKKIDYFRCNVLMSRPALNRILVNGITSKELIVVTFFPSTRNELLKNIGDSSLDEFVIPAERIINGSSLLKINSLRNSGAKQIVFSERHPLNAYEVLVAEKLAENGIALPILAYSSLDDAILQRAGGEKVKSLMLRMGMTENDIIEHAMVEKSIENLQTKIAKKVIVDAHGQSPEEWMKMNLPAEL